MGETRCTCGAAEVPGSMHLEWCEYQLVLERDDATRWAKKAEARAEAAERRPDLTDKEITTLLHLVPSGHAHSSAADADYKRLIHKLRAALRGAALNPGRR